MGMYCTLRRIPMGKLESYLENSNLLKEDFYSNEVSEIPQLDIDKSWDGIIFLLTGKSHNNVGQNILASTILGTASFDESLNLGYGAPRYLLPEEVKSINNKIKILNVEDLKFRFNAGLMIEQDVYPDIWEDQRSFEYLQEYFVKIQSFYQHASWANEAIVITIL